MKPPSLWSRYGGLNTLTGGHGGLTLGGRQSRDQEEGWTRHRAKLYRYAKADKLCQLVGASSMAASRRRRPAGDEHGLSGLS